MRYRNVCSIFLRSGLALALFLGFACAQPEDSVTTSRQLTDGWSLQAAAEVTDRGAVVSSAGFDANGWFATVVPSTPMAALVANGLYPDLYLGTNLEHVDTGQFEGPWWYRTEFEVSAEDAEKVARLQFAGINYAADIWLNGEQLAARNIVVGAFRVHELDVGGRLVPGRNALALAVYPPQPGDFTIGFVDWNPRPPDENMGIWRPVTLRLTGDVSLNDVAVQTEVDLETLESADIRVSAVVRNHSDAVVKTAVSGRIEGLSFAADVILAPYESQLVWFTPDHYDVLRLDAPRLWWPHTLGEPNLYSMTMTAKVDGRVSDSAQTTFGIRQFGTYLNDEGHRGFTVNGQPVLIRGGGWVDDLLLSDTPEKIDAQLAYVKQMHLNTIRLEGFWGSSHYLYDAADREGILIMPGWSCQWEWEEYLGKPVTEDYGGVLEPEEMDLVAASLADQMRYLRNHPSIFTWVLASDLLPHPDLERRYEKVLADIDPTRPPLVSCGWLESEVSGPSGVKMRGPYDWVPPVYWYSDTENGGAYGFNTETGPGPQPPPLESVRRMIPPEHLWPIDEVWNYHCGRNEFNDMDRYVEALDRRYGPSDSVEEFLFKAQAANYEAIRPMFESFAVNRPLTTGLIQWMLNSAWPETYWQLYDWYLMPNGAFYGTLAACQPLSLAYNYDNQTVYAVNDSRFAESGAVATVRAFDLNSNEIFSRQLDLDMAAAGSEPLVSLAELDSPTPVYFLDLRLADTTGAELARNFYWLSTRPDVLDYENHQWFVTPTKGFADFAALDDLPEVVIEASAGVAPGEDGAEVTVLLSNPSDALAFFVELRVVDAEGSSILPVLWNDNYVSILPGESRELTARLPTVGDVTGATLALQGWNVPAVEVELGRK
jgi:exo-1,4-beta-D-glucosaminidase